MHKDEIAMQVLEEIQNLIQDRIGGGLGPKAVKVESISMEPDADDMGEMGKMESDDLGDDDAKALSSLYESEGIGSEEMPGESEDASDKIKKMMGRG